MLFPLVLPVSGNAVDEHQADDAQHGGDAAAQHHEDADMADAGADFQHEQQDDSYSDAAAQQQQDDHEQQQQQQQLHTTESDALLNLGKRWLAGIGWILGESSKHKKWRASTIASPVLVKPLFMLNMCALFLAVYCTLLLLEDPEDQQGTDAAAAAGASAGAGAGAGAGPARVSAANSDAAEDNLLSGLADDDDFTDAPKAAGVSTPDATAAAAAANNATNADLEALPESVKQGMNPFEQEAFKQQLAGKQLNARQRRSLLRLIARGQGVDAAAAAKIGINVNGLSDADKQQLQHQQQPQQPKVSLQRRCC